MPSKGAPDAAPHVLPLPAEDILPVPTEAKAFIGSSRVELSAAWHNEEVLWVGTEDPSFALTYNPVGGPCLPSLQYCKYLRAESSASIRDGNS